MSYLTWGVDASGKRHYLCKHCELVFGIVEPSKIFHECDKTKPKYHNKDKIGVDCEKEIKTLS